jgi:hypothetical protein
LREFTSHAITHPSKTQIAIPTDTRTDTERTQGVSQPLVSAETFQLQKSAVYYRQTERAHEIHSPCCFTLPTPQLVALHHGYYTIINWWLTDFLLTTFRALAIFRASNLHCCPCRRVTWTCNRRRSGRRNQPAGSGQNPTDVATPVVCADVAIYIGTLLSNFDIALCV